MKSILGTVATLVLPALCAFMSTAPIFRRFDRRILPLRVAVAIGLGIGASSVLYFVFLLAGLSRYTTALDSAVWTALLLFLRFRRTSAGTSSDATDQPAPNRPSALVPVGVAVLAASMVGTVSRFVADSRSAPHGLWDAWAIWNLHARFLARAGAHFRDLFTPILWWSHPDYPLLLSSSVARAWKMLGSESSAAPQTIGFVFTMGIVLVVVTTIWSLRTAFHGCIAGFVLCRSPIMAYGTHQCADVPLAFYIVSTAALICFADEDLLGRRRLLALAGVLAGLAAWTKNEGLLFAVTLCAGRLLAHRWRWRDWAGELGGLGAGALPVFVVIAVFKLFVAPQNDLVAAAGTASALQNLTTGGRYRQIFSTFRVHFLAFYLWVALAMGLSIFTTEDRRRFPSSPALAITCVLQIIGYLFVFVLTPHDLGWHLFTASNRLFLQLYPLIVLATFLALPTLEECVAGCRLRSVRD